MSLIEVLRMFQSSRGLPIFAGPFVSSSPLGTVTSKCFSEYYSRSWEFTYLL